MITSIIVGSIVGLVSLVFFPKGLNDPKWWMLIVSLNFVVLILMELK